MVNSQHHHESEWLYSTILSKKLLTPLNEYIHELPSVSHPTELFIASCGYAFNPVMFILWPILLYGLWYRSLSSSSSNNTLLATASNSPEYIEWREAFLRSYTPKQGALLSTGLYLLSVLVTLALTEIGKASFATTRPRVPPEGYNNNNGWRRRYGKLVASLKSKHSFPSGDCAQAMNLCMFLWRYVPGDHLMTVMGNDIPLDMLLFGIFLPGVAFARVFYRCHWIEDCIGGVLLSWTLHWILMPELRRK